MSYHSPHSACFTMRLTCNVWLKKTCNRVLAAPVTSAASRLSRNHRLSGFSRAQALLRNVELFRSFAVHACESVRRVIRTQACHIIARSPTGMWRLTQGSVPQNRAMMLAVEDVCTLCCNVACFCCTGNAHSPSTARSGTGCTDH